MRANVDFNKMAKEHTRVIRVVKSRRFRVRLNIMSILLRMVALVAPCKVDVKYCGSSLRWIDLWVMDADEFRSFCERNRAVIINAIAEKHARR